MGKLLFSIVLIVKTVEHRDRAVADKKKYSVWQFVTLIPVTSFIKFMQSSPQAWTHFVLNCKPIIPDGKAIKSSHDFMQI